MKDDLDNGVMSATPYDADFYIWTQEQAALLRKLPRESLALDIDHIAEEIEDMGVPRSARCPACFGRSCSIF